MTVTHHLSTDDLAGYLDGRLPAAAVAEVERHLAGCPDCRADLVATRRVLTPARWGRPLVILATLGAAAAILLVSPRLFDGVDGGRAADRERTGPPAPLELGILTPRDGATSSLGQLQFAWRSAGPGAHYRLSVADSTGRPFWTMETADTVARPVLDHWDRGRASYFWFLDAVLPDGRIRTSGTHRFTVLE